MAGIKKAKTNSFKPIFVGSKNNSSNRLLNDIQSKKKVMNKFLFWIKIIRHNKKINNP